MQTTITATMYHTKRGPIIDVDNTFRLTDLTPTQLIDLAGTLIEIAQAATAGEMKDGSKQSFHLTEVI